MSTVEGWETHKINDICSVGRGRVISAKEIQNNLGIYPVYSSQSANNGEMGKIETFDFDGEYVTWTTDGAYAGTVFYRRGKFNCTNVCGTLASKNDNLSMPFLAYKLSTVAKNYVSYIGNPKLMNNVMAGIEILLPNSKPEQTKIAEILSCIDTAIEQTEAMIAKQQRIKTGLMQDLLSKGIDEHGNIRTEQTHAFKDSELGRIPLEWELKQLGDIFQLKSGITPLRANAKYFDFNGHNWVKTLDLNESYLFTTEEKISDFALKNTSIALMPKNSLLVAMYGGWEQIGRTAILKNEAATNQAITCLYNPKIEVEPEFAQIALQYFRYTWKKFAVSTRKDPNITKTDIEKFLIPLPPNVAEQKEISKMIFNVKQDIDISNNQLTKLRQTKTALMQDLLSGNVRVNHLLKTQEIA
jgi:type I restriction enzyme S subunit